METEDIFSLIGAFALPIAVFALMLIFLLPGDQNLSTYVQGNMSSEPTTTYTPTNGSALNFDGVNDYVSMSNNLGCDNINFTISLWAKASILDATYDGLITNHQLPHTGAWAIVRNSPNQYFTANYFNKSLDFPNVSVGEWNNYVYIKSPDNLTIYFNGAFHNSTTGMGNTCLASATTIRLGTYRTANEHYFNGSIDEVLIFNRSLNSTEVEQLYNSGVGLYANTSIAPFDSGLVSGYHFDEGTGTTAIDVTGRNNGKLVNGPSWVSGKVPHIIATQVLGAIGLMPWVSATNFISTDFSLQWIGNTLKNPWKTISTLGNSTNRWNVHLNNVTMNGTQGWSGNCVNSSILNGIIVGCND